MDCHLVYYIRDAIFIDSVTGHTYREWLSYACIIHDGIRWGMMYMYSGALYIISWDFATILDAINLLYNITANLEVYIYGQIYTTRLHGGLLSNMSNGWTSGKSWEIATYTRDAIWLTSNIVVLVSWLSYGEQGYGVARGGISCLNGSAGFGSTGWTIATKDIHIYINSI